MVHDLTSATSGSPAGFLCRTPNNPRKSPLRSDVPDISPWFSTKGETSSIQKSGHSELALRCPRLLL